MFREQEQKKEGEDVTPPHRGVLITGEPPYRAAKRRFLRSRLARCAVGIFALKVAAAGLSFITSMLLARLLGAMGYGVYTYALTWVNLLSVPAVLGLDKLLVREVAVYQTRSAWALMSGILRCADQVVLLASLSLALLAAGITWILAEHFDSQMLSAFWVALVMLPVVTLTRLRQAVLQGLHYAVVGQLPETLILPVLFIALIVGGYALLGGHLSASWTIGMYALAAGIAFPIGAKLLHKTLPQAVREVSPLYETRAWLFSALPLLFINGMQIVHAQTSILILGAMKGAETVGVYTVANRGAGLISFVLITVNVALAPTIASLYAAGDMKRLQYVITKSARTVSLLALPAVLGLILFGQRFLSLFGQDFTEGERALAILSIGEFINTAAGSVGLLLTMTGHERDTAKGLGVAAGLHVILSAILIPEWGVEGAATAKASSTIIWNLLLIIWVYKRLGIYPTALGQIGFWRKV